MVRKEAAKPEMSVSEARTAIVKACHHGRRHPESSLVAVINRENKKKRVTASVVRSAVSALRGNGVIAKSGDVRLV